jgi:DNA sulfur modification protein DndD
MMRLRALHLTDFGPFKGTQTVKFPPGEGVTVFYGENMRGKTTLLNAIRFVLFGSIIARSARSASLHNAGNWEQQAAGKYGFSVALDFTHEGRAYALTRSHRPRHGITVPRHDDDYLTETFLSRDGDVLGPQERQVELQRILPEQISRFFLFDGELLQEYEDLLSQDSEMGHRISEAIERILGVPVLTRGRATLAQAKSAAERRAAQAAQGDHRTREYGSQLEGLRQERDTLDHDLERQTHDLEDLRKRKSSLEEALKKKERFSILIEKRDGLNSQIDEIERRMDQRRDDLRKAMEHAWSTLLIKPITAAIGVLSERESALRTSIARVELLRSMHLKSDAECPACLQHVSSEAKRKVEATLAKGSGESLDQQQAELSDVRRRLEAGRKFANAASSEVIQMNWGLVEEAARELFTKRDQRDDLDRQLNEVNEDALRSTKAEYEKSILEISSVTNGIQMTRRKLEEKATATEQLRRRLDRSAGADLEQAQKRWKLLCDLHDLLNEAVGAYRERLRKSVEADASKHFLKLTTEEDYKGLSINANYGLTILHNDGTPIPVRSAGAEHIVALSLIGALQNNAPLKGPILIDSPFGRLDSGHRKNIVRALPTMAEQVALLVYEEELPPALARSELKGKLLAEYKLDRRSARHTELVART